MSNTANLKPFKKGISGNPKGRPPKEYCLTDLLRKQGDIQDFETNEGLITRKEGIAEKLWDMAISGDVSAIKYLYDRLDGKPLQTIESQVTRPVIDMGNISKEDMKALARINRKRKS